MGCSSTFEAAAVFTGLTLFSFGCANTGNAACFSVVHSCSSHVGNVGVILDQVIIDDDLLLHD